jgi:RNA polymerase sigma-70 factor (ECF subfamily)
LLSKDILAALEKFSFGLRSEKPLQKQVFYLLYEFAYRVCVRYTGLEDDPNDSLYEGFAAFFSGGEYQKAKNVGEMKSQLKKNLIRVCIKKESFLPPKTLGTHRLSNIFCDVEYRIDSSSTSRQIINVLRQMPYKLRTVYNMSVIDGYSDYEVSLEMNMSMHDISTCLSEVRSHMEEIFQNVKFIEAT